MQLLTNELKINLTQDKKHNGQIPILTESQTFCFNHFFPPNIFKIIFLQPHSTHMSQIKGNNIIPNIIPEIQIWKFLFSNGLRYKLHDKSLLGNLDIVLPKFYSEVFLHGCFLHGHENYQKVIVLKTKTDFCLNKIKTNKANDKKNTTIQRKDGWKVFTVWEYQLNNINTLEKLLRQI